MKKALLLALGLSIAMSGTALADGHEKGEKVFKKRCKVCHTVEGSKKKVGPTLAGIIGRKAGTAEGYTRYKGLKGSDIIWDEANLDKWLTNPKKFIGKKTTMTYKLKKAKDRAAVIAYLKTK